MNLCFCGLIQHGDIMVVLGKIRNIQYIFKHIKCIFIHTKDGGLLMLFLLHCNCLTRKVQNLHSQSKPQVLLTVIISHIYCYRLLLYTAADVSNSILSTLVVGIF